MKFIALLLLISGVLMADEVQFEMTIHIKAPKAKVWEALTAPEVVKLYYLCPLRKMGQIVGDDIEYGNDKTVLIGGKITKLEKDVIFSHTFIFDPTAHKNILEDKPTLVTYELSETEGITQLHLKHTGFADKNQTYVNVIGGWPWIMSSLKTLLETGKAL